MSRPRPERLVFEYDNDKLYILDDKDLGTILSYLRIVCLHINEWMSGKIEDRDKHMEKVRARVGVSDDGV